METTEWEKYYYAGAVRLAMREGSDNPLYLIGDHLGSTSLVLDTAGLEVAKQSYLPFGEDWGVSVTDLPTDFTYTGQREATEIGLHYYVARWYDSEIGHFIQADSIVPGAGNPMAWNRFAYVKYNPLMYIDPSGHFEEYSPETTNRDLLQNLIERAYNLSFTGLWATNELNVIYDAVTTITSRIGLDNFRKYLGANITHGSFLNDGRRNYVMGGVMYLAPGGFNMETVVHEFGHVIDNNIGYMRKSDKVENAISKGQSIWRFDATIFGGGAADDLFYAMGGNPGGTLRFMNGDWHVPYISSDSRLMKSLPTSAQFADGLYGNYASAEYFAETWTAVMLGNSIPTPENNRHSAIPWMIKFLANL